MITKENRKLFGKIHIADFTVLVLLILALIGAILLLGGSDASAEQDIPVQTATEIPVTVVVRAMNMDAVRQSLIDPVEAIGSVVVTGDATITDIVFEDSIHTNPSEIDGTITADIAPAHKDIVFTLETTKSSDDIHVKIGTQEIRAGKGFFLTCADFEYQTVIQSVIIEE